MDSFLAYYYGKQGLHWQSVHLFSLIYRQGDVLNFSIINGLTDNTMLRSTSIYWHSFFHPNNSWADGPSFANQCPIAADNSFLYTFPTGERAETFWYHSHLSIQYCGGLRGALRPQRPELITHSTTFIFTLINGLSRFAGGPTSHVSVISVTAATRYRFLLISLSCNPNFIFSIDGHTFTIIEVDIVNHAPLTVDSIQIFAGKRYSFFLTDNQAVDNDWIHTVANGTDPHPVDQPAVPGLPVPGDVDLALNLTATDLLPSGSVYVLPPNQVLEISIPGGTAGAPHLHGHNFHVVRSAGNTTYIPIHDVVSTGAFATDNTTIRFTDNAGPWFLHCHIDFHLKVGLTIVFAEDPVLVTNSVHPPAWDDLCPVYDALTPDQL
ncbi:multicopper oxidase-domain-containing protein [Mycena epipterygia]|nr:multicopper oxidase-domain-containing protein [Mycena epipterygia]